jgi:hypothetical protein
MSKRYRCNICRKTLNAHDNRVLEQLPYHLRSAFPAILTKRSGVSKELAVIMRALNQKSVGPQGIHCLLREIHTLKHAKLEHAYLTAQDFHNKHLQSQVDTLRQSGQRTLFQMMNTRQHITERNEVKGFSSFEDQRGYAGFVPSAAYLRKVFTDYCSVIRPLIDRQMMALGGTILKGDHSFKLPKRVCHIANTPIYNALYTALNEYGEIRIQVLATSKSLEDVKRAFETMYEAYNQYGHEKPKIFFSDNVRSDKLFLEEALPSLKAGLSNPREHSHLPMFRVPDTVSSEVVTNRGRLDDVFNSLLQENQEGASLRVGFNSSWSSRYPNSLIVNIAWEESVYSIELKQCTPLPLGFITFLTNSQAVKIGRQMGSQFARIHRLYGIQCNGSLEIGSHCRERGCIDYDSMGVRDIVAMVLNHRLPDPIRGANTLSQLANQQEATATEALAILYVYKSVRMLPIIGQRLTTVPPIGAPIAIFPTLTSRAAAYGVVKQVVNLETNGK